jgi:hypothetical protein
MNRQKCPMCTGYLYLAYYTYREEILFWKIEEKPAKLLIMMLSYYATCKPYFTHLFINL